MRERQVNTDAHVININAKQNKGKVSPWWKLTTLQFSSRVNRGFCAMKSKKQQSGHSWDVSEVTTTYFGPSKDWDPNSKKALLNTSQTHPQTCTCDWIFSVANSKLKSSSPPPKPKRTSIPMVGDRSDCYAAWRPMKKSLPDAVAKGVMRKYWKLPSRH